MRGPLNRGPPTIPMMKGRTANGQARKRRRPWPPSAGASRSDSPAGPRRPLGAAPPTAAPPTSAPPPTVAPPAAAPPTAARRHRKQRAEPLAGPRRAPGAASASGRPRSCASEMFII